MVEVDEEATLVRSYYKVDQLQVFPGHTTDFLLRFNGRYEIESGYLPNYLGESRGPPPP